MRWRRYEARPPAAASVGLQTGDAEDYSDPDFPLGMLRVFGTLIAKGTEKDRILFTNMEDDGEGDNWGAVQICSDKNKSAFAFCTFEYARGVVNIELEDGQTVNATGALSFIDCGGTVENCVFRGSWAGLNAKGESQVKVRFSDFVANKYGMESNGDAKILLNSCIVYGNENGFFINQEGGVTLSYCFVEKGSLHENAEDVKGNILNKKSPLFKDEDEGDFRLDKKSPCLKKGEGNKNIGAY